MADPLDKNTIDALAAAMAAAMNKQGGNGGSRPYDQTHWGEYRSPAQLAADMKKADRTTKSMIGALTKLNEGMKTQGKTAEQLAETMKHATQSTKKSMEIFGHDFQKAEKAFTEALKKTLDSDKTLNTALKTLAGNIDKMEDVFQFDELTKALVEMSEQMEDAKRHATDGKAVAERLLKIQQHLDKTSTSFEGVDASLKDFDKLMDEISERSENGKRSFKNQEEVGHVLKEWLKNNKISPEAQQRIKDLGLAGVAASSEKAARGLQHHASLTNVAGQRIKAFAEKTFTAATALDMLIKAATKWYSATKDAWGTGTEKGFFSTLGRDISAVIHGVNPDVVQQVQVRNAQTRANMGRGAFDKQTYAGVNELTDITGDRNEALKLQGSLQTSLAKVTMNFDKMPGTIHKLSDSFMQLQYMTGMNAEQFAELNAEILGDGDTRRLMLGLQDKEKAAMIESINKRIVENTQLGYSIDQTKEQIKLLAKLFDPLKPKNRFENSVKENVFLRTQGVNAQDSAAIAKMDQNGGPDKYKQQLIAGGMSQKQADDYISRLSGLRQNTAKKYQGSLAENNGRAFVNEALGDKLGMSSTYGSDAWLNSTPQGKEGKDDFKAAVDDFGSWVTKLNSSVLSLGDRGSAIKNSIIGPAIGGIVAAVVAKRLGVLGVGMKMLKGKLPGSVGEGLAGLKGILSKGAGVAGASGAVGPEIEIVNGIPRAKAAAEGVSGVGRMFNAAKGVGGAAVGVGVGGVKGIASALKGIKLAQAASLTGKMLKGGPGGLLATLALMGAQGALGTDSKLGKAVNSNTVNGVANGAGIGGLIGSAFGGIGAIPGAAIGAGIGGIGGAAMDAWDYFSTPNTPKSSMPQSPTDSQPPLPVNKSDADFKNMSDQTFGKRSDPQQQAVEELKKQNDLLSKILAKLSDQTDSLNDNGNKSVDAMTRLQRALKNMGNGDSDLVAASKYN